MLKIRKHKIAYLELQSVVNNLQEFIMDNKTENVDKPIIFNPKNGLHLLEQKLQLS